MKLGNLTFVGNGINVLVTCPRCGSSFDAAPGDGMFATGPDGQLVKVRDLVARLQSEDPSTYTPNELAEALEATDPRLGALAQWVRDHQDLVISVIVQFVIAFLTIWLTQPDAGVSPEQIHDLIEQVQEQSAQVPDGNQGNDPERAGQPPSSVVDGHEHPVEGEGDVDKGQGQDER